LPTDTSSFCRRSQSPRCGSSTLFTQTAAPTTQWTSSSARRRPR
jgi:hypothetical protein